jgi:hypothetical protein
MEGIKMHQKKMFSLYHPFEPETQSSSKLPYLLFVLWLLAVLIANGS